MEQSNDSLSVMSVNFVYALPQSEHIGEAVYMTSLEETILNFLMQGTLDVTAISNGIETTLNLLNLDESRYVFGQYDEWYSALYNFVNETIHDSVNLTSLNFVLMCYGGVEHRGTNYGNGIMTLTLLGNFNHLADIQKGQFNG